MTDQPPLRHKSDPPVHVLTLVVEIELRRRHFWMKSAGGVYPAERVYVGALDALKKKMRSAAKLDALRLPRKYLVERREMVDYPRAMDDGWAGTYTFLGSGPTEAMCKNLTLRLTRTGMKWDAHYAAGLMTLIALRENRQWSACWETRKIA